jgi:hypothetical protein
MTPELLAALPRLERLQRALNGSVAATCDFWIHRTYDGGTHRSLEWQVYDGKVGYYAASLPLALDRAEEAHAVELALLPPIQGQDCSTQEERR